MATDTTPKLCIHCAHFQPFTSGNVESRAMLARCAVSAELHNPVDGSTSRRFCENERSTHGQCGPEARQFKPDTSDITP